MAPGARGGGGQRQKVCCAREAEGQETRQRFGQQGHLKQSPWRGDLGCEDAGSKRASAGEEATGCAIRYRDRWPDQGEGAQKGARWFAEKTSCEIHRLDKGEDSRLEAAAWEWQQRKQREQQECADCTHSDGRKVQKEAAVRSSWRHAAFTTPLTARVTPLKALGCCSLKAVERPSHATLCSVHSAATTHSHCAAICSLRLVSVPATPQLCAKALKGWRSDAAATTAAVVVITCRTCGVGATDAVFATTTIEKARGPLHRV